MPTYRVEHYLTFPAQRDLYVDWLNQLADRTVRVAVVRRVMRLEFGNFGDLRFCRDGVRELRIDMAGGIRVYYALSGQLIVLLLCGAPNARTSSARSISGKTGKDEKMRSRSHDEAMAELYRDDPAFALDVLNSILEDGNQAELLIALRHMTKAFGGVQAVAEQAKLNPTQLYRTLSPQGNPGLSGLTAILRAMGLRLAVEALPAQAKSA